MNIVLGITSSIAAYKTIDLARILKKKGHSVSVIMTEKATHLIDPDLFAKESIAVYTTLFDNDFSLKKTLDSRTIDHIQVSQMADIFVIVPATANTIGKLALGIADDFLSTAVLATTAPVLICPAMNTIMWQHQAVENNLRILASYGYTIVSPTSGTLACGTDGIGRMAPIETIISEIEQILERKKTLNGKQVIITAGGTIEHIDAVRTITNKSTGKMGVALANEYYRLGADVTLLRGSQSKISYFPIKQFEFKSAEELETLIKKFIVKADIFVHTAAVSDFRIDQIKGKLDSGSEHNLTLIPTTKIIEQIKKWNPDILLIGFKAVYGDDIKTIERKVTKLQKKTHADFVVANDISRSDIGFESDDNEVYIFDNNCKYTKIDKASKKLIAKKIIENTTIKHNNL